MDSNNEVTIYGAGMSGLIAAVNLARVGYAVTVHEKEAGYGGSQLYNPSTHVTPIDPVKTSEYIGIDISPAFHQVLACPSYFHDTKVMFPVYGIYAVERGDRPTSLDTLLYQECLKHENIKFEFDSPLKRDDIKTLPPNTIIACGLIPSAYDIMDVPYLRWYGWISRGEIGMHSYAWLWWDECISEYGYFSAVNDYYFDLLFSIRKVGKDCLKKYQQFMVRNEGIEHDNWDYVSGAVPLGSPDNPRLFWKGAIMCGTMSGAMDPMLWFGISGAIVTGKVAAMAVSDPAKAMQEFERFTRWYKPAYAMKNKVWYKYVRPHVNRMEAQINLVGPHALEQMGKLTESGRIPVKMAIPGFSHLSCS